MNIHGQYMHVVASAVESYSCRILSIDHIELGTRTVGRRVGMPVDLNLVPIMWLACPLTG